MQRMVKLLATSCAILLCAGAALAAQPIGQNEITIHNLPDTGMVTVSGTIEKVDNAHEFTLRDNSGAIDVKMTSGESAVIKQGDKVTVSGSIERPLWGLMGKDIAANDVQVHTDLRSSLSDAITRTTGISLDKAQTVQISKLPAQGMVQITGTVDNVSDQKHFTLKDPTGTIDVSVQSDENLMLAKGAEITVTGYVNNGALGKKLNATHVIVMSSAPADTGHMDADLGR